MNRRKAPKGYRIKQWDDGFYHVYGPDGIIDEVLTRKRAIEIAVEDKKKRAAKVKAKEVSNE